MLVAASGCAPAPVFTACLTSRDCEPLESCLMGRCVSASTGDTGLRDTGTPGDASMDSSVATDSWREVPDSRTAEGDTNTRDTGTVIDAFELGDMGTPIVGDTCSTAPVDLTTRDSFSGTLAGYGVDYGSVCVSAGLRGPDRVFFVDVPMGYDVDLHVRAAFDTQIAISTDCDDTTSDTTFFDCSDDASPANHDSHLILHRYPYGRAYILVGARGADAAGAFTLSLMVTPPADSSTCTTSAIDLGGGGKLLGWVTSTAAPAFAACIPGALGVEESFRYTPDADGILTYASAYFAPRDRALTVRSGCRGASVDLACAHGGNPGVSAVATAPGGDYYLGVHGFDATGGEYYSLYVLP